MKNRHAMKSEDVPDKLKVYLPLRGPWIIDRQWSDDWPNMPWSDAKEMAAKEGKLKNSLDLQEGQVAWQESENNKTEMAGHFYDTSD